MILPWLTLFAAIAISMGGQTLLKAGAQAGTVWAQLTDPKSLAGLCLYGTAALLYMMALRRIPMSVALPCTAVSYVAAALIGHFVFNEALGLAHVAAIGLISAGVILLVLQ
jgi:multidrug transporter EmrE-like cation transporter